MRMEDHPMALNFINSIIKNGLRNSNLVQIGRNPRFFDPDSKQVHKNIVEIWPGFFTSTWIFQSGLYLIIDNISKYLSSDNCYTVIENMRNYQYESNESIGREFEGAVVMVTYGQRRTYKVHRIAWTLNPLTYKFAHGNQNQTSSMYEYLKAAYGITLSYPQQPLLEIQQKRQNIYLPCELCTLVGLPPSVRNDMKMMAELKKKIFQDPFQKIQNLQHLSKKLQDSQ